MKIRNQNRFTGQILPVPVLFCRIPELVSYNNFSNVIANLNNVKTFRYNKRCIRRYPRHLWHFSPSVMQQFGAKHDFILCERHPMPFDAFYVSMLSEKYRKSAFPFIKGLITGAEAWIVSLAKKDRSSSMIYVFRKK